MNKELGCFELEVQPEDRVGDINLRLSEMHEYPQFHSQFVACTFAGKDLERHR